jgi:hypothetical protein
MEEQKLNALASGEDVGGDEGLFDSNCITPGTEFMDTVGRLIVYHCRRRLRDDPQWKNLTVYFSGHDVRGEGEHKIVRFIRRQRQEASYDPNTRHCMAGLDADLIMLGLATHEPHFTLLREQVDFLSFKKNKYGTKTVQRATNVQKWQLLHVGLLREYLEMDLRPTVEDCTESAVGTYLQQLAAEAAGDGDEGDRVESARRAVAAFPYDGERVLDDFILLVALCGNDFIPHLPSLDVGEGAMDRILEVYRCFLPQWGDYMVTDGVIHRGRLEALLRYMGSLEERVFYERAKEAAAFDKRRRRFEGGGNGGGPKGKPRTEASLDTLLQAGEQEDGAEAADGESGPSGPSASAAGDSLEDGFAEAVKITEADRAVAAREIAARTAARLTEEGAAAHGHGHRSHGAQCSHRRGGDEDDEDDGGARGVSLVPILHIKKQYYQDKFGITYGEGSVQDEAVLFQVVQSFVEALQWVMLYYSRDVPSWGWFYPFHYAPMTSDLVDLEAHPVAFRKGAPFTPFQQLLGCLPAASAQFLPHSYQALMVAESSPIRDFYPDVASIRVDMNGKRNPWEGVTLVPFIQEQRMLDAIAELCPESSLTPVERARNRFGRPLVLRYDPARCDVLECPVPGLFPDVPVCNTAMTALDDEDWAVLASGPVQRSDAADSFSTIDVDAGAAGPAHLYPKRPPPGCLVPAKGYPTLHSLPLSYLRAAVSLNVFGTRSRKETFLVALGTGRSASGFSGERRHYGDDDDEQDDDEEDALPLHTPLFSVPYAPRTTVAQHQQHLTHSSAPPLDLLTAWRQRTGVDASARIAAKDIASAVLGTVVYAEWPHLREALVVGLSDATGAVNWESVQPRPSTAALDMNSDELSYERFSADASANWGHKATQLRHELRCGPGRLGIAGIQAGRVQVLAKVRKLVGMSRDPITGALHRVFASPGSNEEVHVPLELLLEAHPIPDERFLEQAPRRVCDRFPVGSAVLSLRGECRGALGKVAGYADGAGATVRAALRVVFDVPFPESAFGHNINANIRDTYYEAKKAAEALRITPSVLGRITGSVIISAGRDSTFDIGLNLKVRRNSFLPGYVRMASADSTASAWLSELHSPVQIAAMPAVHGGAPGQWEYTERAIHMVAAYMRQFPFVFELIEKTPGDLYVDMKRFPGGPDAVVKVCTWLQQLDTYNRPLVPTSTQFMCPDAILAVESAVKKLTTLQLRKALLDAGGPREGESAEDAIARLGLKATTQKDVDQVLPEDIYAPEEQAYGYGTIGGGISNNVSSGNVDGDACIPVLGDRVANISFRVAPLGLRGTVIAVHAATGFVEIIFDSEFVGGTSLNNLCSQGHGALVPWSALLCLSRKPGEAPPASAIVAGRAPAATSRSGTGNVVSIQGSASRHADQSEEAAFDSGPRGRRKVPDATAPIPFAGASRETQRPAQTHQPQSRAKEICEQVEFYLSDRNLAKDAFMQAQLRKDKDGWIDLTVLTTFKRMKTMGAIDTLEIAEVIRTHSRALVVSADNKRVKRVLQFAVSAQAAVTAPAQKGSATKKANPASQGPLLPAPATLSVDTLFASAGAAGAPASAGVAAVGPAPSAPANGSGANGMAFPTGMSQMQIQAQMQMLAMQMASIGGFSQQQQVPSQQSQPLMQSYWMDKLAAPVSATSASAPGNAGQEPNQVLPSVSNVQTTTPAATDAAPTSGRNALLMHLQASGRAPAAVTPVAASAPAMPSVLAEMFSSASSPSAAAAPIPAPARPARVERQGKSATGGATGPKGKKTPAPSTPTESAAVTPGQSDTPSTPSAAGTVFLRPAQVVLKKPTASSTSTQ